MAAINRAAKDAWLIPAAILIGAVVLVACGSGDVGGRGLLAGTDTDQKSVSLKDIHFDLFTGSTISLFEITEEELLGLRDRIPPLDNPIYESALDATWLAPTDLVLGFIARDGQAYAYPARILNFHEIVNTELADEAIVITFCPLCRSGVIYDRHLGDRVLSFGNTSALYQSDLVMYDRETLSYWFQAGGEGIVGELSGLRLEAKPSTLTSWGQWLTMNPETLVLSRDSFGNPGYLAAYQRDPFLGIETHLNGGGFPFPVTDAALDDRLQPADLVLGIEVDSSSRTYPISELGNAAINETLNGTAVVIFALAEGPVVIAFSPELGDLKLTFQEEKGRFIDAETSSVWLISGTAISGPLAGEQLTPLPSRTTFWFAHVAAFPHTTIYGP